MKFPTLEEIKRRTEAAQRRMEIQTIVQMTKDIAVERVARLGYDEYVVKKAYEDARELYEELKDLESKLTDEVKNHLAGVK
jgi:hypothetical protein